MKQVLLVMARVLLHHKLMMMMQVAAASSPLTVCTHKNCQNNMGDSQVCILAAPVVRRLLHCQARKQHRLPPRHKSIPAPSLRTKKKNIRRWTGTQCK